MIRRGRTYGAHSSHYQPRGTSGRFVCDRSLMAAARLRSGHIRDHHRAARLICRCAVLAGQRVVLRQGVVRYCAARPYGT